MAHGPDSRRGLLSHRLTAKVLALVASWVLRLGMATLKFRFRVCSAAANPAWRNRPAIFVFWHEMLFFPIYTHARYKVSTLVSEHRDGEFLAQVLRMLGGRAVRGSTTRSGIAAVRKLIRLGRISHLAIAPDGPVGPRRVVGPGVIFLASRTGMPIVPLGFAFRNCWREELGPDGRAEAFPAGPVRRRAPMTVPSHLTHQQIAGHAGQLQAVLEEVQSQADALAARARDPEGLLTLREVQAATPPER